MKGSVFAEKPQKNIHEFIGTFSMVCTCVVHMCVDTGKGRLTGRCGKYLYSISYFYLWTELIAAILKSD